MQDTRNIKGGIRDENIMVGCGIVLTGNFWPDASSKQQITF